MASGWANDDAVNEQINSTIEDAIARARVKFRAAKARMNVKSAVPHPAGPSGSHSGVRLCIHCQQEKDLQNQLIQDIIAEVRKTASYVNYNWRDA